MNKVIENMADLIKVKTIVTLVVLLVFAVMAFKGEITPDQVIIVVTNVIAFYFGTQHEGKKPATVTTVKQEAE